MTDMSFEAQWRAVKPVWRVVTGLLIGQLIGMAFVIQRNIAGDTFFNLWYAGAYATPIGFLLGAGWHLRAVPNGYASHRSILLIIAAFSIVLPALALITYYAWPF